MVGSDTSPYQGRVVSSSPRSSRRPTQVGIPSPRARRTEVAWHGPSPECPEVIFITPWSTDAGDSRPPQRTAGHALCASRHQAIIPTSPHPSVSLRPQRSSRPSGSYFAYRRSPPFSLPTLNRTPCYFRLPASSTSPSLLTQSCCHK